MPKCFLSYHSSYSRLVPPFKNLLELFGFEVDVFDEPNLDRSPRPIMEERIAKADAAVILYGPEKKPARGQNECAGAPWPTLEAEIALLHKKPFAIFLHNKTKLPNLLEGCQTCAHFDFWEPWSFVAEVHNVVKHIRDLKSRLCMSDSPQPYFFRKVSYHNRIDVDGKETEIDLYHEVVAQQSSGKFSHAVDTCQDETPDAAYGPLTEDKYKIVAVVGRDSHRISIEPQENNDYAFHYMVNVAPPLAPKEVFAYRTSFKVRNRFPLTYAELEKRQQQPGFPRQIFPHGFYGDFFTAPGDTERVTLSIHFPLRVKLEDYKVLVLLDETKVKNEAETQRCMRYLDLKEDHENAEKVLEVKVNQPLLGHAYYLLYKPGD